MNDDYQQVLLKIKSDLSKYQKIHDEKKRLIIVSKSQTTKNIQKIISENNLEFGENYVEEGIIKIIELNDERLKWHFIGKIQSNKIKKIVKYFDWVQTVSSLKHAKLLDDQCNIQNKKINICVQINIDEEDSKGGIKIDETELFLNEISSYKNLVIRGIMSIPSKSNTLKEKINSYSILKLEYDKLTKIYKTVDTLSIGMSNDYDIALNYGSNMIRIGQLIFGERT